MIDVGWPFHVLPAAKEPKTGMGCQLSLMRALIRRTGVYVWHTTVCMVVLASVLGIVWGVCYALSVHHRRQAERALEQLAALQPGATSFPAVQRIARDSGGKQTCTEELCRHDFGNASRVSVVIWKRNTPATPRDSWNSARAILRLA
jgi:MFS superfamily sulfate permease-like transporter